MIRANSQRGVTLIEVLITLVIMAVSLSGVAAIQISSMQSATQAKYRSAAITSAQSILETMRSARTEQTPAETLLQLKAYAGSSDSMPGTGTRVGDDYAHFKAELDSGLENREPEFEITVADDRLVTVTISWTQQSDLEDGTTTKSYAVSALM